MESWHSCDTTHCRAGWVVHLAGEEGYELERKTSTPFAAMQIYHKSSEIKVSPVRFYEDNKKAMEDIKQCAEKEKALQS
jgi:ribosomal protein S11